MKELLINNRFIGPRQQTYVIAEMSANHLQDFNRAVKIIEAAKESGADAIKLQTYTPDTITIDVDNEYFRIKNTIWAGQNLYSLYKSAFTPWEWHAELKSIAEKMGLDFFSSPFDLTAVDFLESLNVPLYKIASSEVIDISLIQRIGETGKPVIMSVGMADLGEIEEAVNTLTNHGTTQIALLKCTASYPAKPEEMNLDAISYLSQVFNVPCGLSDHSTHHIVPVIAVALGACIIEKHLTLSRTQGGPDDSFSLEPDEFKEMVANIRIAEKAVGTKFFQMSEGEIAIRKYRKSLFVVKDVRAGETFNSENIRSIRPGDGMHPRHFTDVMDKKAKRNIEKGTPMSWELID